MKLPSSALLLVWLVVGCATVAPRPDVQLERLPEHLDGATVTRVERFAGEEMYNYMNGAAVTYLEQGPVWLVVGEVALSGVRSQVEVYDLGTPGHAAAIYTAFAAGGTGEALAVGEAGTLWPSVEPEAIFWRGRHFVRVMSYAGDAVTGKRVATAVATRLDRLLE